MVYENFSGTETIIKLFKKKETPNHTKLRLHGVLSQLSPSYLSLQFGLNIFVWGKDPLNVIGLTA